MQVELFVRDEARQFLVGHARRSYCFALTSAIMLLRFGGSLVERLERNDADHREVSRALPLEEWQGRPWRHKHVDSVCRLTAALM